MSHFTKIKTRLVNKIYLLKALKDLGYQPEEGDVEIQGYANQRRKVCIKVTTSNPGYDIGFIKEGEEYKLVADWYGIKDTTPEEFLKRLYQRYAYHAVKDKMREQGFDMVEEEHKEDNSIRLLLRRIVF